MAYNNPHPPFPAPDAPTRETLCDLGCIERFTPKRLRDNELFKMIDYLGCYQDNMWTDEELLFYLQELEEFFRRDLSGGDQLLNWYSLISWLEANKYTWVEYGVAGLGSDDFFSRYDLSLKDIWVSMSKANGDEINERSFEFYEWFLRPYIGTNLIQRKLLEKLEIDGQVIDWYENKGIPNSYSFLMDEYPGDEKARLLIINSKLLKNAESILISLRDSRCPTRFLLSDGGVLDRDFLSDIISNRFEGVNICFQRYSGFYVGLFSYFDFDTFVRKLVTKVTGARVFYFDSKELSGDLDLDGLSERMVFETKTNIWPTTFVQLMPAYVGNSDKWSYPTTWEDHFIWGSEEITNLVRTRLPYEESFEGRGWTRDADWQRWTDWHGEQNSSWRYNKPPLGERDYYENRNFIPTYEPSSGNSLYAVVVKSKNTQEGVSDVFNNRKQMVRYWDVWELSENEFISPNPDQEPKKELFIRFQHTRTPNTFKVDYDVNVISENLQEEIKNETKELIAYWDTYPLSNREVLSGRDSNTFVYFNHTRVN